MEAPLLADESIKNTRKTIGGWKACIFILSAKCLERMAFSGVDTNLVTYLTTVLHKGNAVAANISSTWAGTCNVATLIGAVMADAYLGRYWTMAISSTIYVMGFTALTLFSALKPAAILFYLGLYLMAVGSGNFMPCIIAFGGDQFDDDNPRERQMKSSFFNWFFFSINLGTLVSGSCIVWVEDNVSWALGFGILTALMGVAMGSFLSGTPLYKHQRPGGSPVTRICQVVIASLRKLRIQVPCDKRLLYETGDMESAIPGSRKLEHTNEFECLDKAATVTDDDIKSGELSNPWRLCTVTQVEELKILIRMLPIWANSIIFSAGYAQIHTMFVEQGKTMDTSIGPHFKIPPASLSIFNSLTCMVWVPVYDSIIVPLVQKFTGNVKGFSNLQRIGIGLLISIASMVAAALLEIKRLDILRSRHLVHDTETPVPISVFWQIPQYVLEGAAFTFALVGQLEFFYEEAPDAMRTLCSALSHVSMALGNYLSTLLVTVVSVITTRGDKAGWIADNLNEGHLDYYFWVLALLSLFNLFAFIAAAHRYKYKHVK